MITQLEDISNKVAQTKISSDRLRNEEIRRRLYDPWSLPEQAKPVYVPKNVYEAKSQNPTLATTYSTLLNNAKYLEQEAGGNNASADNGYDGRTGVSDAVYGNLPGLAGFAAGQLGAGPFSGAVSGAVSGLQGNIGGALKGIGTTVGALAGMKGYSGLFGTLARDMYNDVPVDRMVANLGWNGLMTAVSTANPAVAGVVGLSSLFGFDIKDFIGQITGIESLRDETYHKEKDFWSTIEQKMAMEDNPTPMDTVELGLPTTTNDDPQDLGSLFGDDFGGFAVDNSTGLGGLFGRDYGDTGLGATGDIAGSGTGNRGDAAEGMGGPDGPSGGDAEGGGGEGE